LQYGLYKNLKKKNKDKQENKQNPISAVAKDEWAIIFGEKEYKNKAHKASLLP